MEVHFATNRLKRCYENSTRAFQEWGPDVARRYIQRVETLYAVERFEELYTIRALRLHPLTGDRAGEYAITLIGRWRVIVVSECDHQVHVKEVTNHYGD